jgi:glucokinase
MSEIIIGVDLGGTRIRAARLDKQLNILERKETLTLSEQGVKATLDRITGLIRAILPTDGTPIAGIGISSPGPLNPATGVVVAPPNLTGWHNVPLAEVVRTAFDCPVYINNDANVAALAETVRGAARGCRHVIYLTISTGIGSGIIVDGRMLMGREGLAAEAGFMVMLVGDRVSLLEYEAAGPDMAMQAQARIEQGEKSAIRDLVAGDLTRITGSVVGQAAQRGDALALEIVRQSGRLIGLGIVSLLHLFNPEIIVIGGGVALNLDELLFAPMREAIHQYAIDRAYWEKLRIERSALGEDVSIIGAGALVATQGGVMDVGEAAAKLGET